MLILARKLNEKVVLEIPASTQPTEVVVCISDIIPRRGGGVVRIGFEAPVDILVWRKELKDGSPV